MLNVHSSQIVFFIETKCDQSQMERIRKSFGFLNGIDVFTSSSRGGLCLAWKDSINISFPSFSNNLINVIVKNESGDSTWRLTGFYGSPYESNRELSWESLRQLGQSQDCHGWLEILLRFFTLLKKRVAYHEVNGE